MLVSPFQKRPFSEEALRETDLYESFHPVKGLPMSESEASEIIGDNFQIAQLADIEPTPCPCGQARRAFMNDQNTVASMHLVEIKADSETHYHKRMTEIYYVLEGEGEMELDGKLYPLKPGTSVMIQPGCRHRAIGAGLKILNVPIPKFDPADEFHD